MSKTYIDDKDFKGKDFSDNDFQNKEYENCTFSNCTFTNTDLSGGIFVECYFIECDFSMPKTADTAFRNVNFNTCKLLGIRFEDCNKFLFEVYFNGCQLDLSSFYNMDLKQAAFKKCSLKEVDFTKCDLTGIMFSDCDLAGTVFENSILEESDFRTAVNYVFDPELNRIKHAKFSQSGISGLLHKYNIDIE